MHAHVLARLGPGAQDDLGLGPHGVPGVFQGIATRPRRHTCAWPTVGTAGRPAVVACLLRAWGWDHCKHRHPTYWATLILKTWLRLRELQIPGGCPTPLFSEGLRGPHPSAPRAFSRGVGRSLAWQRLGPVSSASMLHMEPGMDLETCRLLPPSPGRKPPREGAGDGSKGGQARGASGPRGARCGAEEAAACGLCGGAQQTLSQPWGCPPWAAGRGHLLAPGSIRTGTPAGRTNVRSGRALGTGPARPLTIMGVWRVAP